MRDIGTARCPAIPVTARPRWWFSYWHPVTPWLDHLVVVTIQRLDAKRPTASARDHVLDHA
jgi:hypothetical protein